jgi:hypothetical protein
MPKRLLLAVALLLTSITGTARALTSAPGDTASAIVLEANFNADTIGLAPDVTLPGVPAGDFLTLNQTAGTVTVVSSIDGLTAKPVELKSGNSLGGVGLSAWLAPVLPGLERVTVRWRSLARDDNPVFLVRCAVRSATGILASVDYTPHGTLLYNLGAALPVGFQNNRSQQFTIVVDFLAGTTSLSIDGAPVAGFQDVPFAEAGSVVARVSFETEQDHPQTLVVDDISAVAFTRDPDQAPAVAAPAAADGEEGGTLAFQVSASDPDGDPIESLGADLTGLPSGNDATFTPDASNESGEFLWHMKSGEAGQYHVTFTASAGGVSASASTVIDVAPQGVSVTGSLIWAPGPGSEGTYVVTFTATDQFGDQGSSSTTIDVMSAPSLLSGPSRSPGAIQKGPVVSSPTRVDATVGKTSVVTATATDTTGLSSGAASFVSIRSPKDAAGRAAVTLTLTADLSNLPPGNTALFVVDHDPVVLAPATVGADAGTAFSLSVSTGDPDLDPILSLTADLTDLPQGNNAFFAPTPGFTGGTLTWTPSLTDAGEYHVVFTAANELVGSATTTIQVRAAADARVFLPNNKKIRLASNKASDCVYVEPIGNSFDLLDVDYTSVRMVSPGTGSVSSIPAISNKTIFVGDKDRNLIADVQLCFTRADLRLLFGNLNGNNSVPVTIEGQLNSGQAFVGGITLPVNAGNGSFLVSVAPNPLNPAGTLRFVTTRPGAVRVSVYDVTGRLARVLLDSPEVAAGDHAVAIDGRDGQGRKLASGIYFYRVEGVSGAETGRFVIAK